MRVELDIELDLNGMHTFNYRPAKTTRSLEVPKTQLERWQKEYEAFQVSYLRWRRMAEEIEEFALKAQNSIPHEEELASVIRQKIKG